jgi:3-hydroxymyristoyl/3-hydroxydecanoyl-(acyl carrier protein) dehydratase
MMPNNNLLKEPITDIGAIKKLLPHREPMLMVDSLLYFDGKKGIAELTVLETNIFVETKIFTETGLIEHMAQTAALMTGYKYDSQNLPVKEGVNVFASYVKEWYTGNLQTIFFEGNDNSDIKRQICSVLAGYVWDKKNPFVKNHDRLIKTVAHIINLENRTSN